MKNRRLITFAGGIILAIFSGLLMYVIINQACMELTQLSCAAVIGSGAAAIISGYTLTEIFFNRKLKEAQHNHPIARQKNDPFQSSFIWVWGRPIGTIILISVMTIVPVFVRGAFFAIFLGLLFGFSLNGLFRAVTNRLIPLDSRGSF